MTHGIVDGSKWHTVAASPDASKWIREQDLPWVEVPNNGAMYYKFDMGDELFVLTTLKWS